MNSSRSVTGSLRALEESVSNKIKGQTVTPNLVATVMELVFNSLDSKCTVLDIGIDLMRWDVQVHDDGEGILPEEIKLCGLWNYTSKIIQPAKLHSHCLETYGFRGQALASLSAFCILDVISCSQKRPDQTSRSIVRDGRAQPCLTTCSPKQKPGTSVFCRDLFYNRPVARKHIQNRGKNAQTELEHLSAVLRTLSVLHPSVKFSVNSNSSRSIPLFFSRKSASIRSRFLETFAGQQAASTIIYEVETAIDCAALDVADGTKARCTLQAWLCSPQQRPLRSKSAQLVFVNGRPCARGPIHKLLCRAYKATAACVDNGKPDEMDISAVDLGMPQRKKRRIDESDDHDTSRLSVENQHPIFLVSIHCPPADCSFWATDPGFGSQFGGCYVAELTRINAILAALETMYQKVLNQVAPPVLRPFSDKAAAAASKLDLTNSTRHPFGVSSAPPSLVSRIKPLCPSDVSMGSTTRSESVAEKKQHLNGLESIVALQDLTSQGSKGLAEALISASVPSSVAVDDSKHKESDSAGADERQMEVEVVSPEEMAILESAIQTAAVVHSRAVLVRRAAASARSGEPWSIRSPFAAASRTNSGVSCWRRTPVRTPVRQGAIRASSDSPADRRLFDIHLERWIPIDHRGLSHNSRVADIQKSEYEVQEPIPEPPSQVSPPSQNEFGATRWDAVFSGLSQPPSRFGTWISPAFGSANSHRILTVEPSAARRPISVSRADLEKATFIGQAHNKFVVCLCRHSQNQSAEGCLAGPIILLVDQHAADERIRLEAIEDALLPIHRDHTQSNEGEIARSAGASKKHENGIVDITVSRTGRNGPEIWEAIRTTLCPPLRIERLDPSYRRLLHRFRKVVEAWGFKVQMEEDDDDHEKPLVLLQAPRIMGQTLGPAHLLEFLAELSASAGSRIPTPQSVLRIIASKACRGAIMFGDALSGTQCASLVLALSRCRLPFQCAHGRPTVFPLINLDGCGSGSPHLDTATSSLPWPNLLRARKRMLDAANVCTVFGEGGLD